MNQLTRIPGVGRKTALRQILWLSSCPAEELKIFGESFKDLANLKECIRCGMYVEERENICFICSSVRAQNKLLCVVETVADCLAIEKSETYQGTYHLLGGVLNPLLGIGPTELTMDGLFTRVKEEEISDVILALNPSIEGDATCSYIREHLGEKVNVERIGLGMPVGGHLEYLDAMTIGKALENRQRI